MKLSSIKQVRVAINQGAWVGGFDLAGFKGVELNVRGIGNADYNRLYSDLSMAVAEDQRDAEGVPNAAERERIVNECLKRTVLLGWRGIDDEFSAETVDSIFADDDLFPAFRAAILYAANKVALDAAKAQETAEKN